MPTYRVTNENGACWHLEAPDMGSACKAARAFPGQHKRIGRVAAGEPPPPASTAPPTVNTAEVYDRGYRYGGG